MSLGPEWAVDELLTEYGYEQQKVTNQVIYRQSRYPFASGLSDRAGYRQTFVEGLVHRTLLRPHGDYGCAGDQQAARYLDLIADAMVKAYGIDCTEAISRINKQWTAPGPDGESPRLWIVGWDIVYERLPVQWAGDIYYGPDSAWWVEGSNPVPQPPPASPTTS